MNMYKRWEKQFLKPKDKEDFIDVFLKDFFAKILKNISIEKIDSYTEETALNKDIFFDYEIIDERFDFRVYSRFVISIKINLLDLKPFLKGNSIDLSQSEKLCLFILSKFEACIKKEETYKPEIDSLLNPMAMGFNASQIRYYTNNSRIPEDFKVEALLKIENLLLDYFSKTGIVFSQD